jgi:hypothetical protein
MSESLPSRQSRSSAPADWKAAYDALADHTMTVYGIVFGMLTDPDGRYGTIGQRVELAANEVQEAARNLEARGIFDNAGIVETRSRPLTDEELQSGVIQERFHLIPKVEGVEVDLEGDDA